MKLSLRGSFWTRFEHRLQHFFVPHNLSGFWLMFSWQGEPLRVVRDTPAIVGIGYVLLESNEIEEVKRELEEYKTRLFSSRNEELYQLFHAYVLHGAGVARRSKVPHQLFGPTRWYRLEVSEYQSGQKYRFGDLYHFLERSSGVYVLNECVDGYNRWYVGQGYQRLYKAIIEHTYVRDDETQRFYCDAQNTKVFFVVLPDDIVRHGVLTAEASLIRFLSARGVPLENRVHNHTRSGGMSGVQMNLFTEVAIIPPEVVAQIDDACDEMVHFILSFHEVKDKIRPVYDDHVESMLDGVYSLIRILPDDHVLKGRISRLFASFKELVSMMEPVKLPF